MLKVRDHIQAIILAALGGVFGVVGAFIGEIRAVRTDPFFLGPVIEEVMKPAGVYLLLTWRPELLKGRIHTALLAALGGLSFAIIEALVYVKVYVDDPSRAFVIYRFSGPLLLHSLTSSVLGLGLTTALWEALRLHEWSRVPAGTLKYFAVAVGLHSAYNRVAFVVDLFV